VAINLDALFFVEIPGVTNRWDESVEIASHFVVDMLRAILALFYRLPNGEIGMLQAIVGDGVGANVRVFRGSPISRIFCDKWGFRGRRAVARRVAIRAVLGTGFRLFHRHSEATTRVPQLPNAIARIANCARAAPA